MRSENIEASMQKTISYAQKTNPIWPFAAMLVNAKGEPLCLATDCAHISPLFHAEALAIHALISSGFHKERGRLTLFSTAEPDSLSQSAIYWAKITHDIDVAHICYGSSLKTINRLWKFGIDIPAEEIHARSQLSTIAFSRSICEKECDTLFIEAKEKQQGDHPAHGLLSTDESDFYTLF